MKPIARSLSCCLAILIVSVTGMGQERRVDPVGDETGRDAVGFRKDSVTKESVGERRARANTPTTKQAIEDFMEIQKTNRHIQDIAKQQPLVLEGIANAAKDVSTRAKRLKVSLSLPAPPKEVTQTGMTASSSTDELLDRIKDLDANIKAFVTNPLFRQLNDTSRNLPLEASVNLSRVIALSKVVEESAAKLR
jgi:hypothetical protein